MKALAILFLLLLSMPRGYGQRDTGLSPIIFIYDASGSMWGQLAQTTKKEIATQVLSETIRKLPENQQIGLVAYGHRRKSDCEDVEFLVDVANGTKGKVISALNEITPLGMTPLAHSAAVVIDQIKASKTKATVILITDGIESCDGDICEVVNAAKKEGIDFRLHIIGFGLKPEDAAQLICAAIAGDGHFYDAADAGALAAVLNEAMLETIDTPKANVSVFAVKNGIAIDAYVTAYDIVSKRKPISVRTYRDTAYFYLPPSKYNFEAKSLEGSDVRAVTLSDIQSFDEKLVHQNITFDAGKVAITTTNNGTNWDCLVKVVDQAGNTVASVRTYREPKEVGVNPGTYKLTIQALAMDGMSTFAEIGDVVVAPAGITPISFEFESGTVTIDAKVNGKFIDSMVTVDEVNSGDHVASGRTYDRAREFLLNPGTYSIKVLPLGEFKAKPAQIIQLEVHIGETVVKSLNF